MNALRCACADQALALWNQDLIGLHELRRAQAVKRIVELNLQRSASGARLSHALVERGETLAARGCRSRRVSARFAPHTRAAISPCSVGVSGSSEPWSRELPPDGRAGQPARDIDRLGAGTDQTRARGAAPPRITPYAARADAARRSAAAPCLPGWNGSCVTTILPFTTQVK